jgi:hypothetical protein
MLLFAPGRHSSVLGRQTLFKNWIFMKIDPKSFFSYSKALI